MNSPAVQIDAKTLANAASKRYAIVLAGGSGTRLWPLSRTSMPKQLLALNGDETLLQQTAARLLPMVEGARVVTVTHAEHRFEVAGQLHAVDSGLANNVLVEPVSRNTLPAIAWAVAKIAAQQPDAVIGVFSSDHAIADGAGFHAAWEAAELAAQDGYIALFGMQPTQPATGYGYIEAGAPLYSAGNGCASVRRVKRFVEKPNFETAQALLSAGGHYWNGGMFVFRADRFLSALERHQPEIHAAALALGADAAKTAPAQRYGAMPDLSIDYGLLEHADNVAVVPADIGWSDLGSWEALYQQRDKDRTGNMVQGQVLALNSQNNLLWSEQGLVATLGLNDMVVVQTRDATLVCPREQAADLKQLVNSVKQQYPILTETHLTVARPWGSYTILEEGPFYKIKRIVVNPGHKLSMQMHYHRSEHWVVVAGTAKVTNGEQEIFLEENQSTYIPKTHRHRLENPGKIALQIIEIQTGAYLEEDDIVRFGDVYGR
jgi:mannose-1-phosphate guanylyltransferase / mannose-6-phosphate isomerase